MAKASKPTVTKKNGEVVANSAMFQNIVLRPVNRTSATIEKWRQAHIEAESGFGTRVTLYDLYEDARLDGFLERLIKKRLTGVLKHRLKYVDKNNVEIEVDDLLKSRGFRKLRKEIGLQAAYGIAVIELSVENGKLKVFSIPKKHIRPNEGVITQEQYDFTGIDYRTAQMAKTVVQVGENDDLGYLLQASCYAFYKRGNIADWANYAQIFGMPFRVAKYDGYNPTVRSQVEQAMEKAASAAYAIVPKEVEFEIIKDTGSSASNEMYDTLRKAMNEEMTVLIIGATETTTSSKSSGYAQSETHLKSVEEVMEDDKENELSILNEDFLPVLQYLGLLPKGGAFKYEEVINITEAKDKVNMALTLRKGGTPVSDDYLYEVSGIPKPDDYEVQKKALEEQKANDQANAIANKKKLSVTDELKSKFPDFFE